MKCNKCGRPLADCQACKGKGDTRRTTCTKCNHTGQVCPQHGGHWK